MSANLCNYIGVKPPTSCSVDIMGYNGWEPVASNLPAMRDDEKKELLHRLNKYALVEGEPDPRRMKSKRRAKAIVKKFLRELNK